MTYPDWALKHKTKGTELRKIGNNYYLYKVRSEWNKEKKRAQKITEKFLGKVTVDGLIKPKQERLVDSLQDICVKEFGASQFITTLSHDTINNLKESFLEYWKEIFIFAVFRFFYNSPLKNVQDYYHSSHLSDIVPDARVSPKTLSNILQEIGKRRNRARKFLSSHITEGGSIAVDLTHIFSLSENVISSTLGRNSEQQYLPQINLFLLFSLDKMQPIYYRMLAGSIRDVSSLLLTMEEAGIKNVILVGDKGFYSLDNAEKLDANKSLYILPLRRNSQLIDYSPMNKAGKKGFDGHFLFENRIVWYYESLINERRIVTFLDEKLRVEEERDLLIRVHEKKVEMVEFYSNEKMFGTISIITKTDFSPQKIFELLKSRVDIEIVFDTFKNVLNADRSYMREDSALEGWMFVNFVALLLYYKIYMLLVSKDFLSMCSPKDVILHLSRINKVKIADVWKIAEIPKKSRKIIEKFDVELHIT